MKWLFNDGTPCGESYISPDKTCRIGTDSPAFKAWFGDSKVVDKDGKPLRVFHGTNADFATFESGKIGTKTQTLVGGFFFSKSPDQASEFSGMDEGSNVKPVYLSIKNPLVIDADGRNVRSVLGAYEEGIARELGHDGIIVRNVVDSLGFVMTASGGYSSASPTDIFIAFSPTQIKSTFNRGSWSKADPHISNEHFANVDFKNPMPFREAVGYVAAKKLLPTRMSSEELMQLSPALRERSMFSAKTSNAWYLQQIKNKIDLIVGPESSGGKKWKGVDAGSARAQLKAALKKIGYKPAKGKRGTIEDLSSDPRLNLIVSTQTDMAHAFGQRLKALRPEIMDAWPAYELVREEERTEPRNWPERWEEAGGEFYEGDSDYPEGRMVALKDSPIWAQISAFGLPYPPFDFNSGMGLEEVSREDCIEIGLITDQWQPGDKAVDDEEADDEQADSEEDDDEEGVADDEDPTGELVGPLATEKAEDDYLKSLKASAQAFDPQFMDALMDELGSNYKEAAGIIEYIGNCLANAGEPCGDSYISPDKTCRIGSFEPLDRLLQHGENVGTKADKEWIASHDLEDVWIQSGHYGSVILGKIVAKNKGNGAGTRFMEGLTNWADRNNKTVLLTPDDSFGASSVSRLKEFYRRFGFKPNKGRSADYRFSETMIRRPNRDAANSDNCGTGAGGFKKGNTCARGAGTGTDSPEFKEWFGQSKVVDKDGKPLRVFHGTDKEFSEFSEEKRGDYTGANSAKLAFFFSDKSSVAETYPMYNGTRAAQAFHSLALAPNSVPKAESQLARAEDAVASVEFDKDEDGWIGKVQQYDEFGDSYTYNADRMVYDSEDEALEAAESEVSKSIEEAQKNLDAAWKSYEEQRIEGAAGSRVMPVYLKLENPLVYDFSGGGYQDKSFSALMEEAIDNGNDGVIMRNVRDAVEGDETSNVYAVFKPEQIKSTFNRGTWSKVDKNISNQDIDGHSQTA